MAQIILDTGAAPSTPSTGKVSIYAKTDGAVYTKDDAGTESRIGKLVQRVEGTPYTTYASSATVIPYDDTIPQNTEGTEYVTVSITPKNASNRLVIRAHASFVSADAARTIAGAIFQDTTANALAVSAVTIPTAGYGSPLQVLHEMAAGTISATTFKFRIGPPAGTVYINGYGARYYGGVNAVRISVEEIAA